MMLSMIVVFYLIEKHPSVAPVDRFVFNSPDVTEGFLLPCVDPPAPRCSRGDAD